jgi:hypothetical protein
MNNYLYAIFGSMMLVRGVLLLIFLFVIPADLPAKPRILVGIFALLIGGAGMLFRYYRDRWS